MLQALDSLKCRRRILLSGTPVQNNLDEVMLAVLDFLAALLPCCFARDVQACVALRYAHQSARLTLLTCSSML